MGPDYLAYALLDAAVDDYFVVLEKLGDRVESLEDELISNPDRKTLADIHDLKTKMLFLRKAIWPLRDAVGRLERAETPLIKESTGIYIRDVYDHLIQIIDNIETFRDMLSGILDIYLSSVSNRMNEVMKILTIIGTIFIPLTFLVGVYGMNFEFIPEIHWRWGYFALFKRKKWL
jgi:magnesium transporter